MKATFRTVVIAWSFGLIAAAADAQDARNSRPFHEGVTDPASLKRVVDVHLERASALLTQVLVVKGARTVENTLQPYDDMHGHFANAFWIANVMQNLHPDSAVKAAAEAARAAVEDARAAVNLRRDVFEALSTIHQTEPPDDTTGRYIQEELATFRRNGGELPEEARSRLRDLRTQLTAAQAEFHRNLRNGNRQIETNLGELEGVPRDFLQRYKPNAAGVIVVPTNATDVRTILESAFSGDLRKRAFGAWRNVAHPENAAVLDRLLVTRYEIARVLGYPHWAELDTAARMTKNSAAVSTFIDQIVAKSEQRARSEYQVLLERKRKDDPSATVVEDWEQRSMC